VDRGANQKLTMSQRKLNGWWHVHIIFVFILGACSGPPTQSPVSPQSQNTQKSQRPISQKECLSAKMITPCFYWRGMSEKKNQKLIIFVHGVFSNSSDTWGDVEGGTTWPAMVREDLRFKDFDIYLFNYHTAHFTSEQMIHEIASRGMDTLKDSEDFEQYQEIYFIAHSMGGLVAKSLLTHLNRGNDVPLLRRVKALITLGTPSQGASLTVLGQLIFRNPQLKDMEPKHLNAWLSDMEKSWNQLMDDRKESQYPRAYCAYETRPYFLGYIVVPQEAAVSRCDGDAQGLPLDHSQLAKPTSMNDDPYKWVMDKVNKVSREVPSKRFVVLAKFKKEAVLDTETGLVWEQSPATIAVSWYVARNNCPNKNVGGRNGWRLPSFTELATLIDPATTNHAIPALPLGHPFTNVQTFGYWSATTSSNPTNIPVAYVVYFTSQSGTLAVAAAGITDGTTAFAWCVYGPMNAATY
jgi:pimeloyl-ACP methyl ester carboxylesterase